MNNVYKITNLILKSNKIGIDIKIDTQQCEDLLHIKMILHIHYYR